MVLFIGGPEDGRWRELRESERELLVPEIPPMWLDRDSIPAPIHHIYRVEQFYIVGQPLYVAFRPSDPDYHYRTQAVLRAVLQRDVATVMGVL